MGHIHVSIFSPLLFTLPGWMEDAGWEREDSIPHIRRLWCSVTVSIICLADVKFDVRLEWQLPSPQTYRSRPRAKSSEHELCIISVSGVSVFTSCCCWATAESSLMLSGVIDASAHTHSTLGCKSYPINPQKSSSIFISGASSLMLPRSYHRYIPANRITDKKGGNLIFPRADGSFPF